MPNKQARKWESAIGALLCTGSIAAAAQKVKISEKTLRTWLKDPRFSAAYRQARAQILEQALGVCQGAAISAVTCLLRNTSCGKAGVEVAAAGKILDHSIGAVEFFDLAQRVAELEQLVQTQGAGHENCNTLPNGRAAEGHHSR
jgi:hypothetical protein